MCIQGDSQITTKYLCGCFVVMLLVIIGLAVSLSVMGSTGASVQMTGENDTSEIRESSGFHVLEVNGSGIESGNTSEWSYMEVGFIIMGIIFFINMTHIFHYCVFTKKLVYLVSYFSFRRKFTFITFSGEFLFNKNNQSFCHNFLPLI